MSQGLHISGSNVNIFRKFQNPSLLIVYNFFPLYQKSETNSGIIQLFAIKYVYGHNKQKAEQKLRRRWSISKLSYFFVCPSSELGDFRKEIHDSILGLSDHQTLGYDMIFVIKHLISVIRCNPLAETRKHMFCHLTYLELASLSRTDPDKAPRLSIRRVICILTFDL